MKQILFALVLALFSVSFTSQAAGIYCRNATDAYYIAKWGEAYGAMVNSSHVYANQLSLVITAYELACESHGGRYQFVAKYPREGSRMVMASYGRSGWFGSPRYYEVMFNPSVIMNEMRFDLPLNEILSNDQLEAYYRGETVVTDAELHYTRSSINWSSNYYWLRVTLAPYTTQANVEVRLLSH